MGHFNRQHFWHFILLSPPPLSPPPPQLDPSLSIQLNGLVLNVITLFNLQVKR